MNGLSSAKNIYVHVTILEIGVHQSAVLKLLLTFAQNNLGRNINSETRHKSLMSLRGRLTWSYEWQNTELPSTFPGSHRSFADHRPDTASMNTPYQTTHSGQQYTLNTLQTTHSIHEYTLPDHTQHTWIHPTRPHTVDNNTPYQTTHSGQQYTLPDHTQWTTIHPTRPHTVDNNTP